MSVLRSDWEAMRDAATTLSEAEQSAGWGREAPAAGMFGRRR